MHEVQTIRSRRSARWMMRSVYAAAGTFLLIAAACERSTTAAPEGAVQAEAAETGSIGGIVLDLGGKPVAGARVTASGGGSAVTGAEGRFAIDGLAPNDRLPVTVSASGFAPTTALYKVVAGQRTGREIRVLNLGPAAKVIAGQGGTVPFGGTGSLVIPPNAFAGVAASEAVAVRVAFYDPANPASMSAAPGDLSAVEADGSFWRLRTNGMLFISATSAQGTRLTLAPGRVVLANVPDRANDGTRWSEYRFDTSTGLWQWTGTAIAGPGVQQIDIIDIDVTANIDVPDTPIPML